MRLGFCGISALLLLFASACDAGPPVIVIDPGHGGTATAGSSNNRTNSSSNNAKSPSGILEKTITLEFSKILREEIHKAGSNRKVGVILTREKDINLHFGERARNSDHPDTACIVSIHFNASSNHQAKGSLTMISAKKNNPNYEVDYQFSKGLAEVTSKGVRKYLPSTRSRGVINDGHLHGGRGSNFFFQLKMKKRLAKVPKCFLEVEFMDNAEVDRALLREGREEKFRHIAKGIAEYLVDYAYR